MLLAAYDILLESRRESLRLVGGAVMPFDLQERIVLNSLELETQDPTNQPLLPDKIKAIGTAAYLGQASYSHSCSLGDLVEPVSNFYFQFMNPFTSC